MSCLYILIISLCDASCYCTSSIYVLINFCCKKVFSTGANYKERPYSLDESEVEVSISSLEDPLKRFLFARSSSISKEHSSTRAVWRDRLFRILLLSGSNPPCDSPSTMSYGTNRSLSWSNKSYMLSL